MLTWFRRFGDVPGLDYETPQAVAPSTLPGYETTPRQTRASLFDGREFDRLVWGGEEEDEYGFAETSGRSPAQAHSWAEDRDELPSAELLQRLWEALELPGEPSDYHFALQSTSDLLWRRRREEPQNVRRCEYIYLLDLRLIEACPEAIRNEFAGEVDADMPFYHATVFTSLTGIYEREGFLMEALRVAETGARFDQVEDRVKALKERIDALQAEDVSGD
jgi:hypothetical protein